jgi:hypothetical protein
MKKKPFSLKPYLQVRIQIHLGQQQTHQHGRPGIRSANRQPIIGQQACRSSGQR